MKEVTKMKQGQLQEEYKALFSLQRNPRTAYSDMNLPSLIRSETQSTENDSTPHPNPSEGGKEIELSEVNFDILLRTYE